MKKVLIYLNENDLSPKGGPLGYNYNLGEGLKNIENSEICIEYLKTKKLKANVADSINKMNRGHIKEILTVIKSILSKVIVLYGKSKIEEVNFDAYDIVHFHQTMELFRVRDSLKDYKGKVILMSHAPIKPSKEIYDRLSGFEKKYMKHFYKKLDQIDEYAFRRADYIVFPCEEAEEPYYNTWSEYKAIKRDKETCYKYMLTGTKPIKPLLDKESIRKKYGIPEDAFVISYVGRHTEIKGYDLLKEYASELFAKSENIYVLVAGKEARLKKLENPCWIEVGWTNDPGSIIGAGDCFVLPNRETYFDLVMLEVLSLGQIVIASETGGNKYFRKYNQDGIFLYNNQQQFIDTINKLRNLSNFEIENMKNNNLELFKKEFSTEAFAQHYLSLLEEILV